MFKSGYSVFLPILSPTGGIDGVSHTRVCVYDDFLILFFFFFFHFMAFDERLLSFPMSWRRERLQTPQLPLTYISAAQKAEEGI